MPIVVYPDKDIVSSHRQQVALPAAMVNTYFFVKSLDRMCEIAKILEKDEDIPAFEAKATEHRKAITAAYYNSFDANFLMNLQGANAYAIDLGLGNEHTRKSLVDYYQKLGCLDTGIFGTDILIRVLFEMGEDELAVDLLTSEGKQGFEQWRQNGATTFHEYWDSSRSRSHNHPMFGASVAYFFEYLLGIRQAPNTAGYTSLIIEPRALTKFQWMRGSMEFSNGVASVSYKKKNEAISFNILLPPKTKATFKYKNQEISLIDGENKFDISL
jgi:alpha-L-rhamnosidase